MVQYKGGDAYDDAVSARFVSKVQLKNVEYNEKYFPMITNYKEVTSILYNGQKDLTSNDEREIVFIKYENELKELNEKEEYYLFLDGNTMNILNINILPKQFLPLLYLGKLKETRKDNNGYDINYFDKLSDEDNEKIKNYTITSGNNEYLFIKNISLYYGGKRKTRRNMKRKMNKKSKKERKNSKKIKRSNKKTRRYV
jgi:hypothetical protein